MKKILLFAALLLPALLLMGQNQGSYNDQPDIEVTGFEKSEIINPDVPILSQGIQPDIPSVTMGDREEFYERLFYTCKVWGFVKYFHSGTADCSINLDSVLVNIYENIKTAANNDEFNNVLFELIISPGEPALPTSPLPQIPDSLMYNLDLGWLHDGIFSQPVKDALDTIHTRFRPRLHCLVGEAFAGGNPTFDNDNMYNNIIGTYPEEAKRVVALFRYWNILNYFFPYKNIMDQDWDTTLTEVIPLFVEATSGLEYDKAILILAKRINDSHAFTGGGELNTFYGIIYPRFAVTHIDEEIVISKVHSSVTGIMAGDIIRKIDGVDINQLRDSLIIYEKGSNDLAIHYYLDNNIINGPYGNFDITVENGQGTFEYTLSRNWNGTQWNNFLLNSGPVWYDTVVNESCLIGYVDMARLTVAGVPQMMNDLWDTDAIIFDIRSYPQGTLWTLVNYLFSEPLPIANFTTPDIHYPGVLFWQSATIGGYNPIVYSGQLIILFDVRTISQAEYTCMGLENHPASIKIGSQTRAADGNVSYIVLPGSIGTYFTGLGTFYPDYTPTQRIGIIPDVEINQTVEGLRQGVDEVLGFAFDCDILGARNIDIPDQGICVYPNPFIDNVTVDCFLLHDSQVTIEIVDLSFRTLKVIVNEKLTQGKHSFAFDGMSLKPGIYFIVLKGIDGKMVEKIIKI